MNPPPERATVSLCACQCGTVVAAGSRFARGHNQRKRWTRERIIEAIQEWTRETGRPPTCRDWDNRGVDRRAYPTSTTVKKVFSFWADAIQAAGVSPPREQRWRELDPAFGHWLAGFIAGEGCFRIHRSKGGTYYSAAFSLKLRDDDRPILEELQAKTGLGTITQDRVRSGRSHPCAEWVIQSRADALELVELLDSFPLRAKKAADYVVWREAVALWATMPRGNRWRGHRDWSPMIELKRQLSEARSYPSGGASASPSGGLALS